jgi:hypothetical protein
VVQGTFLSPHQQDSKVLGDQLNADAPEACVSTLRHDVVTMLQETVSLESFFILSWNSRIQIKAEDYFVLVIALQHNRTLKTLRLHRFLTTTRLTEDESKQLAALLKKNYALECLPNVDLGDPVEADVSAILRLNAVGRRYPPSREASEC